VRKAKKPQKTLADLLSNFFFLSRLRHMIGIWREAA
jgi:hypothetical protein